MDAPKPTRDVGQVTDGEAEVPKSRALSDPARGDPDREARWAKWREEKAAGIAAYKAWFETDGHRYIRPLLF